MGNFLRKEKSPPKNKSSTKSKRFDVSPSNSPASSANEHVHPLSAQNRVGSTYGIDVAAAEIKVVDPLSAHNRVGSTYDLDVVALNRVGSTYGRDVSSVDSLSAHKRIGSTYDLDVAAAEIKVVDPLSAHNRVGSTYERDVSSVDSLSAHKRIGSTYSQDVADIEHTIEDDGVSAEESKSTVISKTKSFDPKHSIGDFKPRSHHTIPDADATSLKKPEI